jgi:uncharacterized protein (TIGR03382 family)
VPRRFVAALLCAIAVAPTASAQTLVPGPSDDGYDAALGAKADAFDLQLHTFMTVPLGWGLEAEIGDPTNRTAVDAFFASGEQDFQAQSGLHPYEVIDRYEEFGDLGMFGGVQAAGDAFRYVVLRDGGAPSGEVDRARASLLRAADGLHWYMQVTGVPGVVARGLRRITSEPGEPPIPGEAVETVPLFDANGDPLPTDKVQTWRDDQSGELPFLIWVDDTSKDQLDGYVLALGVVYDAVNEDPSIPTEVVERLREDARALGQKLMEKVEVAPERSIELVIQDADGRPTRFHDLSAEEITPGAVFDVPINGFNGWMALSIVRTLYHVGGDEALGRFYAEELLARRGYLQAIRDTVAAMYTGSDTNYSNVNMAFVAAYGLLRYENDDDLAADFRSILEDKLYDAGARGLGQSFFDFLYAGFRFGGSLIGPGADAVDDGIATLAGFHTVPYWDDAVTNCDDQELASLMCTASDGTQLALSSEEGWGGGIVAVDPLPIELQPPSNFHWRSDPHSVNGGGGPRLNPGGDFQAAYWMGRMLVRSTDGTANVSPFARDLPAPLPSEATPPEEEAGGCGCHAAPAPGTSPLALAFLALVLRRKRR